MSDAVYSEDQKFTQWWIKAIPYLLLALGVTARFLLARTGSSYEFSYIILFTALLMFTLFNGMNLSLKIDRDTIRYGFWPFHWKPRIIERSAIQSVAVVQYDPVSDFGGWGIRFREGAKAYTVSGSHGLEIKLLTGKTILIGTSRPDELSAFLKRTRYIAS